VAKILSLCTYGLDNANTPSKIMDASGNGYNATLNNISFTDESGFYHNGLSLDGSNYIALDKPLDLRGIASKITFYISIDMRTIPRDGLDYYLWCDDYSYLYNSCKVKWNGTQYIITTYYCNYMIETNISQSNTIATIMVEFNGVAHTARYYCNFAYKVVSSGVYLNTTTLNLLNTTLRTLNIGRKGNSNGVQTNYFKGLFHKFEIIDNIVDNTYNYSIMDYGGFTVKSGSIWVNLANQDGVEGHYNPKGVNETNFVSVVTIKGTGTNSFERIFNIYWKGENVYNSIQESVAPFDTYTITLSDIKQYGYDYIDPIEYVIILNSIPVTRIYERFREYIPIADIVNKLSMQGGIRKQIAFEGGISKTLNLSGAIVKQINFKGGIQ